MKRLQGTFIRFLVAGAINTSVTYVLFLLAAPFLNHLIAYTLAYAFGIAVSYLLNTRFVFRTPARWKTAAAFPLVYAAQYAWGLILLYVLVDLMGYRSQISMLIVIASSVLLTYALTRRVLVGARG
jgi:putative flippase GtrA